MSLRKRVIACLDVTGGRVVKGTRFVDLVDAGDPVELAARYAADGADEIVILDIGASHDRRPALLDLISRSAAALDVPLAVGGGVRSLDAGAASLDAGADKVSVNSGALRDPTLLDRIATRLGSQSLVISIDAARSAGGDGWTVRGVSGTQETGREAVSWAREAVERGAGEVLLTSIDRDGTRAGYDLALTRTASETVPVPVIASGGAGGVEDIVAALTEGGASAALLASLMHRGLVTIPALEGGAGGPWCIGPAVALPPLAVGGGRVAWLTERRPDLSVGLVPVVVQDADDGEVLMLAWADQQALAATERTGQAHSWSRRRNELRRKGATSGNVLEVVEPATDCDGDAVLYRVRPAGPACHGANSCFEVDGVPGTRFSLAGWRVWSRRGRSPSRPQATPRACWPAGHGGPARRSSRRPAR